MSHFWGTCLAYKATPPRKRRSWQHPGSLRSGDLLCCFSPKALPPLLSCTLEPCRVSASERYLPGTPAVLLMARSTPAIGPQSAAGRHLPVVFSQQPRSTPASGLQSATWSTPVSGPDSTYPCSLVGGPAESCAFCCMLLLFFTHSHLPLLHFVAE